jgi:hypothetical protein
MNQACTQNVFLIKLMHFSKGVFIVGPSGMHINRKNHKGSKIMLGMAKSLGVSTTEFVVKEKYKEKYKKHTNCTVIMSVLHDFLNVHPLRNAIDHILCIYECILLEG